MRIERLASNPGHRAVASDAALPPVIAALVGWCTSGVASLPDGDWEGLVDLHTLAQQHGLPGLADAIVRHVGHSLAVTDCCRLYEIAASRDSDLQHLALEALQRTATTPTQLPLSGLAAYRAGLEPSRREVYMPVVPRAEVWAETDGIAAPDIPEPRVVEFPTGEGILKYDLKQIQERAQRIHGLVAWFQFMGYPEAILGQARDRVIAYLQGRWDFFQKCAQMPHDQLVTKIIELGGLVKELEKLLPPKFAAQQANKQIAPFLLWERYIPPEGESSAGVFRCSGCHRLWISHATYKNRPQPCPKCEIPCPPLWYRRLPKQ
eukprot:TRINITY_DN7482_c0_g1_i1.p1 TRINITY_DN7482_c0_g1~~TRINITY_DN7482_c0_g1_i1.p1  ORF type:complete len:327 (-),score=35.10 TRINITY_DN7482_c0_g1_i1:1-960(-)